MINGVCMQPQTKKVLFICDYIMFWETVEMFRGPESEMVFHNHTMGKLVSMSCVNVIKYIHKPTDRWQRTRGRGAIMQYTLYTLTYQVSLKVVYSTGISS